MQDEQAPALLTIDSLGQRTHYLDCANDSLGQRLRCLCCTLNAEMPLKLCRRSDNEAQQAYEEFLETPGAAEVRQRCRHLLRRGDRLFSCHCNLARTPKHNFLRERGD